MAVAKVLRLEEYRDRRDHRLGLARAFSNVAALRAALVDYLVEIATLTGADRVATVWVDEFDPGVVHADSVLDMLSDRPRLRFSSEPLHKAWEFGVPGTYDQAADADAASSDTLAIALGSDGSRAWFLYAESIAGRPQLDGFVRDRVLFLAGEISAIVLHKDLDSDGSANGLGFAGWRTLKDLEGHESDDERSRLVARRFVVLRLASMLVSEGLVIPDDRRAEQAHRARQELARERVEPEKDLVSLEAVLDAYEVNDLEALSSALVDVGQAAEGLDHPFGALEAYECAYDLGAASGSPFLAIEAARKAGRVLRRRAQWEEADRWYGVALDIANVIEDRSLVARSLAGLGLVKRELGNLPAARGHLTEALEVAETSGDAETLASIHHDLMGLEHFAGDLDQALRHGWRAVNTYVSEGGRTRCMASMAGVLRDLGDWSAAEDAYAVVIHSSEDLYYHLYAYDALAHIAALRGDEQSFEDRAAACDALDWENGPHSAKAEILYYRGLSLRLLGHHEAARSLLERAVAFADAHAFNWVLFEAEAALKALDACDSTGIATPQATPAPPEVREGLRAMRRAVVGAGV